MVKKMGLTTTEEIEKETEYKEIISEKAPKIKVKRKVQRQREVHLPQDKER